MEIGMEDAKLIEMFISGNQRGFEMLVKKHQNRVNNIVYSLTGSIDSADDISQEVFIKIYKNLSSFRKKAKFSTWLYRITVNTVYTYLKKQKRYIPLDLGRIPDVSGNIASNGLGCREKQRLLKRAIEQLPFNYRSVVILKDIEGLSYKNIAKSLGCRIGTVESRLFRARRLLKKMLVEDKNELSKSKKDPGQVSGQRINRPADHWPA
ncbi:MAG: sigma-70 family RNA polymerase sigma factor [Candidatus Omnitrophota bacterium]|nr:sigma-70 family RNA polymerase sigma factor [Candidatus Omnitrophota bacterium]